MWWHLLGIDARATDVDHELEIAALCLSRCCCSVSGLSLASAGREALILVLFLCSCLLLLAWPRATGCVPAVCRSSVVPVGGRHEPSGWAGLLFQMLHASGNCCLFSGMTVLIGIMFSFEVLAL